MATVESRSGGIRSTSINGVKVYSIAGYGHKYSAAAVDNAEKRRKLRKDKDYQRRVELIQDLRFETATSRIKVTPDGEYVIASGIYPPQVKVFELKELSLKFERHLTSEIVNFQVLSEDYSKIAFLCADRSVCLHAKYGSHYSLRIPRMGRDIAYDCWSCDLLCAASSPDLYRINLEQGRFLVPLTSKSPAINVVTRSAIHGLIACGGEDGALECFDLRRKSSVGRINTPFSHDEINQEVTALQFGESLGYHLAVGSSTGKVLIYDLRMSNPIRVKDHMYDGPILGIKWHQTLNSAEPKLISMDSHIVKIWDPHSGDNMTSIEPNARAINDFCIFQNSGLMLLALDNSQIPAYFVPAFGPAPKWCSYIENLTEDMEEKPETVVDDNYKFLTRKEMEHLNLMSLIGTKHVKAYLHGFHVDYRIYKEARAIAYPVDYEAIKEKLMQEKIEKERKSRITKLVKLPKVNRKLAERLEAENDEDANETGSKKKKKKASLGADILQDDRFSQMFQNEDFEIDEKSAEYLALHPQSFKDKSLIEEHFEPISEDEEYADADNSDDSSEDNQTQTDNPLSAASGKRMRLYEVKDERHAEAFLKSISLGDEDEMPLGDRSAVLEKQQSSGAHDVIKFGPGGSREISYMTKSKSSRKQTEDEQKDVKRRGVQALGLKPSKSEYYASGGPRGKAKGGRRGRGRGRR